MGLSCVDELGDQMGELCLFDLGGSVEMTRVSGREYRVAWNGGESSGFIHSCFLRPGLSVVVARVQAQERLRWEMPYQPSLLEFCLARGPRSQTVTNQGDCLVSEGATTLVTQTHESGTLSCEWTETGVGDFACVTVAPSVLQELLGRKQLPKELRAITEARGGRPRMSLEMCGRLETLLDELMAVAPGSSTAALHFESKALEVLGTTVDQLTNDSSQSSKRDEREMVRLRRARRILHEQMQSPPTLKALAKQAGLSETRFKSLFRETFGRPVFADLREYRLSSARRLLRERQHSVSEVATTVGYDNPSKFAAAFRKMYGMAPSAVA